MPDLATLLPALYGTPGEPGGTGELRTRAAAAHAGLLARAGDRADPALCRQLDPIRTFLRGPAPAALKRRLLCHHLFVEGLHDLAPFSPALRHWHDIVLRPRAGRPRPCAGVARERWPWSHSSGPTATGGEHDCCTRVRPGRVPTL